MLNNLRTYIVIGRSGLFDKKYYLEMYPDVRKADMDPMMHFIAHGWREWRNPSQMFDTNFYLQHNPDVKQAGTNPLLHYLRFGGLEGRDPGPNFSSAWYLNSYEDVKKNGINPLVHYIKFGQKEGRMAQPELFAQASAILPVDLHKNNTRFIQHNPIIVHQMGKVGSKTVEQSLLKAYDTLGLKVPVYHTHVLNNFDLGRQYAFQEQEKRNPISRLAALAYGENVRRQIDENTAQHWNIVSMVRDPIERNISAFFQNLPEYIPDWHEKYTDGKLSIYDIQALFLDVSPPFERMVDQWFDNQIKQVPAIGIDVYETPFPHDSGYKIFHGTAQASLLLIRLENLNECAGRAMYEFLGLENFTLNNTNTVNEKDYAGLYHDFKELPLPGEFVERIYNKKISRHFYSDVELDTFKKRWTKITDVKNSILPNQPQSTKQEPSNSRRADWLQRLEAKVVSTFKKTVSSRKLSEDLGLIKASNLFERKWYLANNQDISATKVDPLLHYLNTGGFEGRDPSPKFSSSWYLETYDDVKKAGLNPLVHYLKHGNQEGRGTQPSNPMPLKPPRVGIRNLIENFFRLLPKLIIAWDDGGPRLVWQKFRHKFGHVLMPSYFSVPTLQVSSTLHAIPVEPPNLESLRFKPLISVLIPTYNTPVPYLIAAINSVRNQFYPNWEICICDDSSSNEATINELRKIEVSDERIKVVYSGANGGISTATNKAAELAKGEFFAFLDHDDELTSNGLYEIVRALNEEDGADVLYSDQDKIDNKGTHLEPFFKPDWSPIFFRSVMYVGHLLIVKNELFKRMQGLNSKFDGVQDYEFMLRISETNPNVKHIPQILYHWRKIPGSIAMGLDEKGDKIERLQAQAVDEHFARLGIRAFAMQHPTHRHRVLVQPKLRESHPLVSIIILTKDAPQHLGRCLNAIFSQTTYLNFEVIVVDNGTTDPDALRILKENPVKVITFDEKFNYSKANNLGVQNSKGEYIVLLNNDTEIITANWIEHLLLYCESPEVGAVGALLLYPDQSVQHAGVVLGIRGTADHIMRHFPSGSDGYAGSLSCPREVSAVTGACLMIKRNDYLNGGLVEYYGTHYQDVDLCLRLRMNGKVNLFVPHAILFHYENASRGSFYDHLDRALLLDTWGDLIAKGDPYYNPNFLLDNQNFYSPK